MSAPDHGAGRRAASAYVTAVNDRDRAALAELFAEDAVAVNPFGTFDGREAILGFYDGLVFANDVTVEATNVIDAGATCVVELDGRTPATDEVQHMVDLFTVAPDGRVARLAIYRR
jgi:hypothetical protein